PTGSSRGGKLLLRDIFVAILGSEKLAAVLADNLGLGVAENLLGARVPVRNHPVRVHHEDGIVSNVLYRFSIEIFGSPVAIATLGFSSHCHFKNINLCFF